MSQAKFSNETRQLFIEAIAGISVKRPEKTLLDVMVSMRRPEAQRSPEVLEAINYGSYLMELNPGIGRMTLGQFCLYILFA